MHIGTIYLERRNEGLFKTIVGRIFDFRSYSEDLLQAEVHTSQFLSRLSSSFVIGRTGFWIPEIPKKDQELYECVRITGNSEYPRPGIVIADCDGCIVDEHYSVLARNPAVQGRPLIVGMKEDGDFEQRVFNAYNKTSIRKREERNSRLIIYRTT